MPKKGRQATRMTPGFTGPFKGAPQPGTLFDVRALDQLPGNVEATRQRSGPRGYSPARLAEVRHAFDTAHTSGPNSAPTVRPVTVEVATNMNETGHLYGPSHYDPHADPGGPIAGRARSRILDTLSRSTINVADEMENPLAGLSHIRTASRSRQGVSAHGEYFSRGTSVVASEAQMRPIHLPKLEPTRGPSIGLYPTATDDYGHAVGTQAAARGNEPRAEQTLLHELGHHDSYIAGSESSSYDTPRQRAVEEARADRFAVTHFRPDPRNKEPHDPREHTYLARGAHHLVERAAEGYDPDTGKLVTHPGAPGAYAKALPASMHPPEPKRNLGPQFEQPELESAKGRHVTGDLFTEPGVENLRGWAR